MLFMILLCSRSFSLCLSMGAVLQPLQRSILVLYNPLFTTYEPENGSLCTIHNMEKEDTLCRSDFSYVKL